MWISWLAPLMLGAALASGGALAQPATGAPPPATTGANAGGGQPDRTGSVTAAAPPRRGAAVGDELGTRPDLQEKSRKLDQHINEGICTGCK